MRVALAHRGALRVVRDRLLQDDVLIGGTQAQALHGERADAAGQDVAAPAS